VRLPARGVEAASGRVVVRAARPHAEGFDTRILASVLEHCRAHEEAWPEVIQFETMGHSDNLEGRSVEWPTIRALQDAGYVLVGYSHQDTHLVWSQAINRRWELKYWVQQWKCDWCRGSWAFPYVGINGGRTVCRACLDWARPPWRSRWWWWW